MTASFSLIIEDDAGKQIVVPFSRDVITIGRKEGNTIRLTERNVSRFHAKLVKENGHVLVEDLASFNGIKLNGDRINGRAQVSAGDVIEIGDYHLELRAAQQPAAGPVGSKAATVAPSAATDGDDFEGDTQRWEPPPQQPATLRVGAPVAPTQEDPAAFGGFGDGGGDTEKLDMSKLAAMAAAGQVAPPPAPLPPPHSWPPPVAAPPPLGAPSLEPTTRQPSANVPLGGPAPPPPVLPGAEAQASPSALVNEITQDMPAIVPSARVPSMPAAPLTSAPPRGPRGMSEETEQLRPAPALNPADDVSLPRLVVLNTIFAGSTFPIKAMENVLGRTEDNDIVLEHRSVSRNHAKLVRQGDRVQILDLKSANGVLVNGEEVEQHTLKGGDVIELGRVKLRFVPVGERFAVSPEEIERARVADTGGDDFDDGSKTVNVTSPVRAHAGQDSVAQPQKKPVVLYAVLGLLVVVAFGLVFALLGGKEETPAPPPPTPPVGALPPAPATPATTSTPPATPPATPAPSPAPAAAAPDEQVVELEEPTPDPVRRPPPRKREREIDFEAQFTEAQKALLKGDHARAIELLKELEKLRPRDPRVHKNLGINYAKLRKNDEARRHYTRYIELDPNAPDADKVREILHPH